MTDADPFARPGAAAERDASRLGRDGPVVSRIGLGLAALGRPGYMTAGHDADLGADKSVDAMRRRAHDVLDAAWAEGVRYYDAARSYGRAEEFLASWISARGLAPGELTVGSKWGYRYTAEWRVDADVHEIKDHSLPALRRQAEESRRTLGSHLALYQIHSATLETGVLEDAGVLDELARLRDRGLLIGLSLTGARQARTLERAMTIERGGARLFGCVQATWNVLEPSAGPALAEAHGSGMGVIVKEALANGYLVAGGASAAASLAGDDPYARAGALIAREAERLGTTADVIAFAAVLAQPWADCVLSGAARVDHLRSNLGARAATLPADVLERLRAVAMPPEDYWRIRGRNPWT